MNNKIILPNKTDQIFSQTCPYNNPYQGKDKRLLFVCSAGLLRSATAANLFAKKGYNTRSCGTYEYALIPLSVNLIMWADDIFFMEKKHLDKGLELIKKTDIKEMYLLGKSSVLHIPDNFEYNSLDLIKMLEERVIIAKEF